MSHAKGTWGLSLSVKVKLAVGLVLGTLIACSAGDSLTASLNNPAGGDQSKLADGGAATPGVDNASGATGPANSLIPTDNAVIVVHAAGAEAFRLCFDSDQDVQPTPTADLMPQANVVGVEVGSAIRLGPISKPPGEVYYVPESFVRGENTSCRTLLVSPYLTDLGPIPDDLSKGVHLLVVSGCQAEPSNNKGLYDANACGTDYDPNKGNLKIKHIALNPEARPNGKLPFDIAQLSQGVDTLSKTEKLTVAFGDLSGGASTSSTTNPPFGEVTPFGQPDFDPDAGLAIYGQMGFTINIGGSTITQSLADIQLLSSPHDVPPTYYAAGSNYVLLMLGSPPSLLDAGDKDARDQLHFLAVPVVAPKSDADGGADAGDAGP